MHGHAHPMSPCEPLENPTVGGSFCWLVALVRQRLVVGCPLGASSTWRHRRAQKRAGPHHPEPWAPARFFHQQGRDKKPWGLEQPQPTLRLGLRCGGAEDCRGAPWAGVDGRAAHTARALWRARRSRCVVRARWGVSRPPTRLAWAAGGRPPVAGVVCVQSPRRSRPEAIALVALARPGPGAQPWASHSVELARETVAARAPPLHAAALCGGALRRAPWRPATSRPARAGPCRRDTTRAPESGSGPRGRATGPTGARGMSTCATPAGGCRGGACYSRTWPGGSPWPRCTVWQRRPETVAWEHGPRPASQPGPVPATSA